VGLRYGSVCSGIEAASVAWNPLGWEPQFFAEIEAFPKAVLAHHYPDVPNHGDMTKFQDWPAHAIDLLVGGTPCQSFSVAGLRAGLADPRGNLALTYLAIAAKYRPRWLVWENVPGVLSADGGEAFGSILGGMVELGYGIAYRVLDAQFCRASGLPYAVPQRRRRVFVVGYLGDWRRAAAVLFDGASLRGDSPPRREAGKRVAPTLSARTKGGGGLGTDFDLDGGQTAIPATVGALTDGAHNGVGLNGQDAYTGRILPVPPIIPEIAGTLKATTKKSGTANGAEEADRLIAFDTTQITSKANRSNPLPGDPSHPIPAHVHAPAIAIQAGATRENPESGPDGVGVRQDGTSYTIEARQEVQAVAFDMRGREGGAQMEGPHDTANIRSASGGSSRSYVATWAVRRLTPVECARLQGFPDDYLSQVPYRGKPPADGPMYKALGNSFAVNVVRVLGERIQMIDAI